VSAMEVNIARKETMLSALILVGIVGSVSGLRAVANANSRRPVRRPLCALFVSCVVALAITFVFLA
jgi:hypothetical protein